MKALNYLTLLLTALTLFTSCDDDGSNSGPCANAPISGKLTLRVNTNAENPFVKVVIYRGYYEDGDIYLRDTLTKDKEYEVPFGRYSATASYKRGGNTIIAVEGGRVDYSQNTDDENCNCCFDIENETFNLKLKE